MSPRILYLGLCVLGTVLPLSQFLPFLGQPRGWPEPASAAAASP
jgi:hypothetical protein